ncbi:hypothetical protein PO909_008938 [Leuciscus waleckii]
MRSSRIAGSGEKPHRLRKHLQRDESSLKSLAAPPSIAFLLRYPAPISFTLSAVCLPAARAEPHSATGTATLSAFPAWVRSMASLTVTERYLWLTLSEMSESESESERAAFLDAPLSPAGLFGTSVKDFAERFAEVQKASQAMKHFLPKRSSSAAGRAKPFAQSSQPQPPPTAATSQRRQARSARPRSRSSGRRPAPRGPRPRIAVKPEAPKSSQHA